MNKTIKIINDMLQDLHKEATEQMKADNLIRYYIVLEQISLVKILKIRIQLENRKV